MKKIAVVLAGCGFKDGTEITEAVSTLIAVTEAGATYQCFAPDVKINTVNHKTAQASHEDRNVLVESARIARGNIQNITELSVKQFDAVVFPGGYGAAVNLSNWAQKRAAATVHPEVERVIKEFHRAKKPIGAICIAPHLVAKVLGTEHVAVTIGNDQETAAEICKTGADHIECAVDDYVTDRENKVITTPAYMYGNATPFQVFKGIRAAINELVLMA